MTEKPVRWWSAAWYQGKSGVTLSYGGNAVTCLVARMHLCRRDGNTRNGGHSGRCPRWNRFAHETGNTPEMILIACNPQSQSGGKLRASSSPPLIGR